MGSPNSLSDHGRLYSVDEREKNAGEAKLPADRRTATIMYTREGTKVEIRPGTKGGATWQCFPDAIDPRGPKGK